jgi:hypothetical protein
VEVVVEVGLVGDGGRDAMDRGRGDKVPGGVVVGERLRVVLRSEGVGVGQVEGVGVGEEVGERLVLHVAEQRLAVCVERRRGAIEEVGAERVWQRSQ